MVLTNPHFWVSKQFSESLLLSHCQNKIVLSSTEKDSLLFHLTNINNLPALGNLPISMKPHHKHHRPALVPAPGRPAHLRSCLAAQRHTMGQNSTTQASWLPSCCCCSYHCSHCQHQDCSLESKLCCLLYTFLLCLPKYALLGKKETNPYSTDTIFYYYFFLTKLRYLCVRTSKFIEVGVDRYFDMETLWGKKEKDMTSLTENKRTLKQKALSIYKF